jgi:hypothetical protein
MHKNTVDLYTHNLKILILTILFLNTTLSPKLNLDTGALKFMAHNQRCLYDIPTLWNEFRNVEIVVLYERRFF